MPMRKLRPHSEGQPKPRHTGITRHMIRQHACSLFRDVLPQRPLSETEWRTVEEDLVRKLERVGF